MCHMYVVPSLVVMGSSTIRAFSLGPPFYSVAPSTVRCHLVKCFDVNRAPVLEAFESKSRASYNRTLALTVCRVDEVTSSLALVLERELGPFDWDPKESLDTIITATYYKGNTDLFNRIWIAVTIHCARPASRYSAQS